MCVDARRSPLVSRGAFVAAISAAAAAPALASTLPALPAVPSALAPGNAHAAAIAHDSPFIRTKHARAMQLAQSIRSAKVRADVLGIIDNPLPLYARRYPDAASRQALRDRLAQAGFVKPDAPVSGIFPPGTERAGIVQPFWSAAGSAFDSHHSYPGGLLVHELFNSLMAEHFAQTYDGVYPGAGVDRDLVIAAAFYHDIMKTVVFQFNADGTLLPELDIGATGGHHCLSGAEAIVRGHDARFVTVLLSAHAAPSLGDEAKVVTWCRASAMIAGVDPVAYGLVKPAADGYALAAPPPIEAFVNHLSDHDYVLTVYAVQQLNPRLAALAPAFGATTPAAERWWRHRVLSHRSAVELYAELTRGEAAFRRAVQEAS